MRKFGVSCGSSSLARVGMACPALGGRASTVASSAALAAGGSVRMQERGLKFFHGIPVRESDLKRFEEELTRQEREREQKKDDEATEVKVQGPTKYTGAAVEEDAFPADAEEPQPEPSSSSSAFGSNATQGEPTPMEREQPSATAEEHRSSSDTDTDSADDAGAAAAATSSVTKAGADFLYGGVAEGDARAERESAVKKLYEQVAPGDVAVASGRMKFTRPEEEFDIAMQKAAARGRQKGPYIGSKIGDIEKFDVDDRRRRAVARVPQVEAPYEGNETSFRRLPRGMRIPDEFVLRHMYPMRTKMDLTWQLADCVDGDAQDIFNTTPVGIKYATWFPPDYDPATERLPVLVCLADYRGLELDVEDVCANFFERDEYMSGLLEHRWILLFPCINTKHSQQFPMEGIVARFCDWAALKYRAENGMCHIFGRGLGGWLALRTVTYHRAICQSMIAVPSRMASAYRPLERPQEKVHNVEGTHTLVFVPGGLRKLDFLYKWKAMLDINKIRPPTRFIHFAEVLDAQVPYVINPNEFWNYLQYFRQNPLHRTMGSRSEGAQREEEEQRMRKDWDKDTYKEYTDKNGDPLGTVTYEWLSSRDKPAGSAGHAKVSPDGQVDTEPQQAAAAGAAS